MAYQFPITLELYETEGTESLHAVLLPFYCFQNFRFHFFHQLRNLNRPEIRNGKTSGFKMVVRWLQKKYSCFVSMESFFILSNGNHNTLVDLRLFYGIPVAPNLPEKSGCVIKITFFRNDSWEMSVNR